MGSLLSPLREGKERPDEEANDPAVHRLDATRFGLLPESIEGHLGSAMGREHVPGHRLGGRRTDTRTMGCVPVRTGVSDLRAARTSPDDRWGSDVRMTGSRRVWIGLAIALTMSLAVACSTEEPEGDPPAAEALVGSSAPELSGENLTAEGILDLASMEGKPTAVVFWFPECPHCQENVPALQAAWEEIADEANILTVGMVREDPDLDVTAGFETPRAFVATTGLSLPTVLSDWVTERDRWKLEGVPTVFLLDGDQIVRRVMANPDPSEVVDAVSDM